MNHETLSGPGVDADEDATDSEQDLKQRDKLIDIGLDAELWHDADGNAYASIQVNGHTENHRVRSRGFRRWLLREYGRRYPQALPGGRTRPGAPGAQAVREALDALEAAAGEGPEFEPKVRIGTSDLKVYLDLGCADWSAVEIDENEWRIVHDPPVKFIRPAGLRPLPEPLPGGGIDRLRPFVNVASEADFVLVVSWLVRALSPEGPYPVLMISGEPGSTKTTLCRLLRRVIDPNKAEIRPCPRDERDLYIACLNGHVMLFDNLSSLQAVMADGLCRVATGTGFATRTLYTDTDEIIISACKPQVLNGIPELGTRSDLVDRAIAIMLPTIPDEKRKTEAEFWAEFDRESPYILGALLDAVSCALARRTKVHLKHLPRMADYAIWVEAAAPALGWQEGEFLRAYEANRVAAVSTSIDADLVAQAVRDFAAGDEDQQWDGSAG